jgi:DNA topoisomerase-2
MASQYKKHTHREHILELPDTYIGSVETSMEPRWVYEEASGRMVHKHVHYNPGLYKTFDELVVNARDALVRAQMDSTKTPVKRIDISAKMEEERFTIRVKNDGDGIPVEIHPTEKCYAPELIFGHLLTSSNYDKTEEKTWGGKNGYGSKLCNVFSLEFQVHVRDPKNQQSYSQTWKQNMSICEKPSIRKDKAAKGFVEVVYIPDLARFRGVSSDGKTVHADMIDVLHTRAIEIAALVGKDVKVTWNDVEIKADTFDKYVRLFLREDAEKTYVYEKCGDRWEVAAVPTKYLFSEDAGTPEDRHISFVNGINTRKGGKHVETVQRAILDDLCEAAMKKRKLDLKIGQIKDHVTLFVSATIVNPAFDSQTKENLTTPSKNFGSKPVFSGKIIDGLIKAGILDDAQAILDAKMNREAKKTDGGKKRKVFVEKLNDAPKAGTSESEKCTLILTEGDSAKTAAVAGVQVMNQDYWGIFPLRGKVLNVKDISRDKINANEELVNLKKILGLETGKVYKSLNELRYGRIMIMCDQDVDGFHIRGLLMNLFHAEWPSLMKLNFLCSLMTPLVKLTKGQGNAQEVLSFYSEAELENWRNSVGEEAADKYKVKYYKGLGTSGAAEAREWFQKLAEVKYEWDEKTDDTLDMAFNKKRADDRKQWLASYNPKKTMVVPEDRKVGFSDFVNDELIHFSSADNLRSIPHIMDGLKPSQRKILYSCFKRHLTQEIKVAQLAGYVSEHSAYHHGEASLNQAIINMAQVFVGANNLNLLFPSGQFGSRIMGGKDSSAPRYIFTRLEKITQAIYKKDDIPLLKHNMDDGDIVEPEHYLPVIPMLLVNGSIGIGSGYSTTVYPHNPSDIVDCLRKRLRGDVSTLNDVVLDPWWIGYQGQVIRKGEKEWVTKGKYTFDNAKKTVTITELPVDMWIDNYKSMLQKMMNDDTAGKKNVLKDFDFTNGLNSVKIVLYLEADYHANAQKDLDEFEKRFDLISMHKGTNMCCFDPNMNLVKYNTAGEIMEVFFENRLVAYEERRKHLIKVVKDEIEEYTAKYKFVMGILDGTIKIMNQEDDVIVDSLVRSGIPPRSDRANPQNIGAYDYLLRMRVDRIKKSSVEEAKKDVETAQEKLKALENTTAVNMWLGELEEFLVVWEDHKQAMLTMIEGVGASSGVGKGASGKSASGAGMTKAKALAIAKAKANAKASASTKANSVTIDV